MTGYLIIPSETSGKDPFLSPWFDADNHFTDGMVVIRLSTMEWTANGVEWVELEEEHL